MRDVHLAFDRRPSALPYMLRAVRPVRRPFDLAPPIRASWHAHRVDPHDFDEFRRITNAEGPTAIWIRRLLEKKPTRLVTVAIANKTARIAWAVMARGEDYRRPAMG